jgi:hypothetical protein
MVIKKWKGLVIKMTPQSILWRTKMEKVNDGNDTTSIQWSLKCHHSQFDGDKIISLKVS